MPDDDAGFRFFVPDDRKPDERKLEVAVMSEGEGGPVLLVVTGPYSLDGEFIHDDGFETVVTLTPRQARTLAFQLGEASHGEADARD